MTDIRHPKETAFTVCQGGMWIKFQDVRPSSVHAIAFDDGKVWDTVNGWRQETPKIFSEKFSNGDTWELAERMLQVYEEAAQQATGDPETRRIVRMCEVVKALRKEFSP